MLLKILGGGTVTPGAELAVDQTAGAAHVAMFPLEYRAQGQVLGSYGASLVSGSIGIDGAAGVPGASLIAALTWRDASRFLVLQRISAALAVVSANASIPDMVDLAATVFRRTTTNPSGGTAVTLKGGSQKVRQSMGASLVTDLRVATTGVISSGTSTFDPVPFASTSFPVKVNPNVGTTAATGIGIGTAWPVTNLYRWDAWGQHPIILSANEGIGCDLNFGASGTFSTGWKVYITLEWSEVAMF